MFEQVLGWPHSADHPDDRHGDRDRLAELDLLRPVCDGLGDRATLRVIVGADHGFHVLKRSGRNEAEVLDELADATAVWAADLGP